MVLALWVLAGCGSSSQQQTSAPESTQPEATTEATNDPEAESASNWGYTGAIGPDNWGNLDPAYAECSTGQNQSPIDLVGATPSPLPDIKFDYKPSAVKLENNG